ncbi:MAG: hypothetical protein J0H39_21325 [Alphaproteobacteria bacterium]|nr:hypothetical protein [Alphaproteobacteria bacterium]
MSAKFEARVICRRLLDAESEAAVQEIVESIPEMRDQRNWKPLDGRETNFNVTSNQASDGGKALTELMTNMVDAVLTKYALKAGINPKGKNAPPTMHAAVDKLIKKLRGGKLTNLDHNDPWLRDFAQANLVIGVTGAKSRRAGLPCYTFVDNGEGQSPDNFESTFLSLSTGNKKDIPFVQGKYNMGSSGVLGYCGMRWFKLIVSRRYDGKKPWGFTLMRKRPGGGMPVAEYFVLPNGGIPSFEEDALYPFIKGDGKRYDGVHLATGTVIKLYDYQIGSRFSSGFKGSREALNENLVETILPFRILDFRQTPDPKRGGDRAEGIDPRGFCGMEFLLLRSHREDDNDIEEDEAAGDRSIAVAEIVTDELGKISISAIRLKRKLPGWLEKSNNRVFHAVNGQVQFKQTRGYLSQSCSLPALKDRVVVIVDASGLSFEAHNEVWKGDREHVRDTIVGERYKDAVTAAIKESEALKNLQADVAREELEQAAKTQRNDLFQKLVNADRNLAALLTNRDPIISLPSAGAGTKGGDSGEGEFEGNYHPTFLRFDQNFKDKGLALPINRTRLAVARTDAENGYLQRADNKGTLSITPSPYKNLGVRAHLHDGRLMIYLEPVPDALNVGDVFIFKFGLKDDSMATAVEDHLTVRIVDEEKASAKHKGTKVKRSGDKDGAKDGEGPPAPTHGLPPYKLMTKDGRAVGDHGPTDPWPAGFNEHDGGLVEDLNEEGVLYKINYDNSYHIRYRLSARGDVARDVMTEKFILGMRILMLGCEHALREIKKTKGDDANGIAEFQDDFRRMCARGAASTVLALAENLPKIVDKMSVTETQDVE